MSNLVQEYTSGNRTPEIEALYKAYQRGEIDIYGNPYTETFGLDPDRTVAYNAVRNRKSSENLNLTDTSVIGATSSEPTTAGSPPSEDVSSIGMLAGAQDLSNVIPAEMEAIDDTSLYEQRVNNLRDEFRKQYDILETAGFSYVNPSDVDYIIEEQAKEFAKAGVDSIYDLGKRSVDTTRENVEVERETDPNTGNFKYYYNEEPTTPMGLGKRIEVQPSTVKEVDTGRSIGQGATEKIYIATLPSSMNELFNKKTGETVDVFAGRGTLSGDPDEPTTFGNLYSGVEGGAALNVKFAGDKPVFYPLYQDTSDRDIITPAVVAASIAFSAFPGVSESIGAFFPGVAEGSVAAKAIGNAVIAGGTGLAIGKDIEDALLAAIITYGTTYGVDALQSGKFGDYLVDNNILEADTVDSLKIPRGASTDLSGIGADYSLDALESGTFGEGGVDTTSLLQGTDPTFETPLNFLPGEYGVESELGLNSVFGNFGDRYLEPGSIVTPSLSEDVTFADILAGQGGAGLASDLPLLTSAEIGTDAVTSGLTITNAASATKAVSDVLKLGATGAASAVAVKEIADEASKFIDLKEVFGDRIGGGLENLIGTGIDYAGLSALQESLEERGEEIQKEYEGIFKPYTVTTGFGTAEITPEGATATVDAAYQPIREAQLGAATSLFEGLPATREEATAQQLAATRALTEPQRQREQERMLGTLAQRGLLGYGQTMPTAGGQRRVNPLAESILSAQELARSKEALDAQTFGLTEAGRQRQLAQGLLTGAQTIDKQTMAGLTTGRDISATLQQKPELAGLSSRATYDQLVALAELDKIRGLTSGAKGLFGLPTEQGNVTANQIQQIIDLAELLKTRTAT